MKEDKKKQWEERERDIYKQREKKKEFCNASKCIAVIVSAWKFVSLQPPSPIQACLQHCLGLTDSLHGNFEHKMSKHQPMK